MAFIITYTGRQFDFDKFTSEDFVLADIVHALSMLCRFTGHCKSFYSVGMHSILVADMLESFKPEYILEGLMHDAVEAYINDLNRPLKDSGRMEEYNVYEDKLQRAIAQTYDLAYPFPPEVLEADRLAVNIEASILLPTWPTPLPKLPSVHWWQECVRDLQESYTFPSAIEALLMRNIQNQFGIRRNKA